MSRIKWNEAKIKKLYREGHGKGALCEYKPWLTVSMVSSQGRSHRVYSPKTKRVHHLLSDIELAVFMYLEWRTDVIDIREQYPLDRDLTQSVATKLGIRHPTYPGTNVPTVMTADFLVSRVRDGKEVLGAFNAKSISEANDARSMEKLEIQRVALEHMGIPHFLIFDRDLNTQVIRNINWIRDSLPKPGELEPFEGYWASMTSRLAPAIARARYDNRTLAEFCAHFDTNFGVRRGTGIRAARILMAERVLVVDLEAANIMQQPVSNMVVVGTDAGHAATAEVRAA